MLDNTGRPPVHNWRLRLFGEAISLKQRRGVQCPLGPSNSGRPTLHVLEGDFDVSRDQSHPVYYPSALQQQGGAFDYITVYGSHLFAWFLFGHAWIRVQLEACVNKPMPIPSEVG